MKHTQILKLAKCGIIITESAHINVFIGLTFLRINACSVLQFGLWTSPSLGTVTKSNGGSSCLVSGVLLCKCYQVLEADPTWVQSTTATTMYVIYFLFHLHRHSQQQQQDMACAMYVVLNVVYMGTDN